MIERSAPNVGAQRRVRNDDHAITSRGCARSHEELTKRGGHADRVEELAGDLDAVEAFRRGNVAEVEGARAKAATAPNAFMLL